MSTQKIAIPVDPTGFTGRECPECNRYFKIDPSTRQSEDAFIHCPYCGYEKHHSFFTTQGQKDAIASVFANQLGNMFKNTLKSSRHLTYKSSVPPVKSYIEKRLEVETTCTECKMRYSVDADSHFCPGCGKSV